MGEESESRADEVEVDRDVPLDDVALAPSDAADSKEIVERKIPQSVREKYEVFSYRNAAVILAETRQAVFAELIDALMAFQITTRMIRTAGGNESEMPKLISKALRPLGWHETIISADLAVTLS
jgi:hypothetical protein